jgi:hypothetical protein
MASKVERSSLFHKSLGIGTWGEGFRVPQSRVRLSVLFISTGVVGITVCGGKVLNNTSDFPFYQHSQEQLISVVLLSSAFAAAYSTCTSVWRKYGVVYHIVFKLDPKASASPFALANLSLAASAVAVALAILFFAFIWRSTLQVGVFAASVLCCVYAALIWFVFFPSLGPLGPTRSVLRAALARVFAAPFVPVQFIDNIIADSYTSFPSLLQRFSFSVCGLIASEWWDYDSTDGASLLACNSNTPQYHSIFGVFQVLPYWIRFLQCCRRFYDGGPDRTWAKKFSHAVNAGKYAVDITYILLSIARTQSKGVFLYRPPPSRRTHPRHSPPPPHPPPLLDVQIQGLRQPCHHRHMVVLLGAKNRVLLCVGHAHGLGARGFTERVLALQAVFPPQMVRNDTHPRLAGKRFACVCDLVPAFIELFPCIRRPTRGSTPRYYAALVEDAVLRVLWTFSLAPQNFQQVRCAAVHSSQTVHTGSSPPMLTACFQAFEFDMLLASLEIFRRSVWILFRVEWECVNNAATVAADESGCIGDAGAISGSAVPAPSSLPPCLFAADAAAADAAADTAQSLL